MAQPVVPELTEQSEEPQQLVVSSELETYARGFSFTQRRVSLPKHPQIGVLSRPSQLPQSERMIYRELADTRFWNDFDFEELELETFPQAPFRSVLIGEISSLDSERYEVLLELESFEETYTLALVLLYRQEELTVLLIRFM